MVEIIQTLITALIGAGGAGLVAALVKGWREIRRGARVRQQDAVDDLRKWREEADDARREAEVREDMTARDRDYWRAVAGGYRYQLRQVGVEPVPAEPIPPSARPVD